MGEHPAGVVRAEVLDAPVDRRGRLHRSVIDGVDQIRLVLQRLARQGRFMSTGSGGVKEPEALGVLWIGSDRFALKAPKVRAEGQPQIYLQFDLDGVRYFFSARTLCGGRTQPLEIAFPEVIYEAERREDLRQLPGEAGTVPRRVDLLSDGTKATASVSDWSLQGVGVELAADDLARLRFPLRIRYLDGSQSGAERFAMLRYREGIGERVRLGLSVSAVPDGAPIHIERVAGGRNAFGTASSGPNAGGWRARVVPPPPRRSTSRMSPAQLVEYPNDVGEPIRALVNTTTGFRGGTAVVIPPSWGGTKERPLGLAVTLVETFERAGESLIVVRFDGTNRRGESWIAPEFRDEGNESLGFTFSQAIRDILATFQYVEEAHSVSRMVLVTFSLGAIDGRRALATYKSKALAGWVSVVGIPDLQSGMRRVSGGVDYAQGWLRGLRWGVQELLGVRADIDRTGQDALDHDLVFFDDARRDMATIRIPITWFHGRHDGWVDLERVERLLLAGDTRGRRLIELPSGHQMRSSRRALEVFETVAAEVARTTIGRPIPTSSPDLRALVRLEHAEQERLQVRKLDLCAFWSDYLLGSKRGLGVELMAATHAYRAFMGDQIRLIDVPDGGIVVDLGSGTGNLALNIAGGVPQRQGWTVIAVDFVRGALKRGRQRFDGIGRREPVAELYSVAAQLDLASERANVPLADRSVDAVVASLLLSYLAKPSRLLEEARRLLRPGGWLVLSTMRRDADISKLYVEGVAELPPDRVRASFGAHDQDEVEVYQRDFLNNAAQLMRLEEEGRFRFWDVDEFERLVHGAGFQDVEVFRSFGDPPQALVLRARAPL